MLSLPPVQKLLQQLPGGPAGRPKTSVGGDAAEEVTSPVLATEAGQPACYSALHDDLKEMLDSNKDSLKLEAMKRIVAMIARGKNASDLFPAVVKNVACKNIEVKKLVYVYLVRYAEEQQDLALLSISTFQRGLKDPNQLIRASALRVLSSIRVPIIVPIMMLAIKEAASDMSPYVRKTAAHAIPKLYSLDSDQKDQLIEVIEKLLADKTTLVAGSVVMAFEEVCPERIDLIHKNYRKLCNLLIDVEEWGQVVIINMLTRYARTQFLSPNQNESLLEESAEKAFYGSEEEDAKDAKTEAASLAKRKPYVMDPDHRLLLRNTKPLLQSRNAAVSPPLQPSPSPKATSGVHQSGLWSPPCSHSEVQYVVLQNVATMSIKRRGMFEPYLKSFYIRSTDPTQIKILKLEVLTNLANETNISTILREFQTYIRSMDKDFVAATIQAIGRCATNIGKVRDTCLNGLVQLLSNRDELVVAESVVVIKKLLQMQPAQHSEIIKHMAKLTDNIQVPMARASILWLIGEYCEHVPKIAPDVLRKMAKSFTNEEDIVKLQVINLAAKLYPDQLQSKLLTQYVLNLAKYDQNYDIRDRARFIRQLIVPTEKSGALNKYAKKLFLAQKPAPILDWAPCPTLLNAKAVGYQELPDWPDEAPDPSVRNVEVRGAPQGAGVPPEPDSPYSPSEEEEEEEGAKKAKKKKAPQGKKGRAETSSEEASGSESSSSGSDSGSEAEAKRKKAVRARLGWAAARGPPPDLPFTSQPPISLPPCSPPAAAAGPAPRRSPCSTWMTVSARLLQQHRLHQPGDRPGGPHAHGHLPGTCRKCPQCPSWGVLRTSATHGSHREGLGSPRQSLGPLQLLSPAFGTVRTYELLHRMAGEGLSVEYCFSRRPFPGDPHMVAVQIQISNNTDAEVKSLRVSEPKPLSGMRIQEFPEIERLAPGDMASVVMGIDFCDSTQAANFQLCTHTRHFYVSIQPPVGELMAPVFMSENEFKKEQGKLTGMSEITEKLTLSEKCRSDHTIVQQVTSAANVGRVPCGADNEYRFAAKTVTSGSLVLITLERREGAMAQLTVNSEKMVIGTMLVKDIVQALAQ
uniref:AP-3 complex subunit beta n=1 Tax=Aquila chrysaetos chrysaetos TaxID=223781 RepID=A0A663DU02_AQUCH